MKNRGGKLVEGFITGLLFVTSWPIWYYEIRTLGGRTLSAVLAVGSSLMIASVTALLASAYTLVRLYKAQSSAKNAVSKSAGYAVFSNFGMKVFVAGGGSGNGVVLDKKKKNETFMNSMLPSQ